MIYTKNCKLNYLVKNGFTLVELLIVTTILAILSLFAIPSYQNYIIDSKMKEASLLMLKDAQFMEHLYGINGKYANGSSIPTLPYTVSPESGSPLYRITLSGTSTDENSYLIKGTPICNTVVKNSGCVCVDQDNNVRLKTNGSCNNGNPKDLCPCIN